MQGRLFPASPRQTESNRSAETSPAQELWRRCRRRLPRVGRGEIRYTTMPGCWLHRPRSADVLSAATILLARSHPRSAVALANFACGRDDPQCIWISWQLDYECCSPSRLALNTDSAAVIADHRLHDRQPQSCAVLFSCVVRSENAFALFWRQARAGVGDFDDDFPVFAIAAQGQRAAIGHGVHGIEYEIRERAMHEFRVRCDCSEFVIEIEMAGNRWAAWSL